MLDSPQVPTSQPSDSKVRGCPICGSSEGEVLHSQELVVTDDYPLPKHFDIVMCSTCGMVYTRTTATQEDYDNFYTTSSVHQNPAESSAGEIPVWEVSRLLDLADVIARSAASKTSRILDVGCSSGGLLKILSSMGYDDVVGVDPSPVCVSNARSNGIEAYQGEAGHLPDCIGTFDLVTLTGVLEHVLDLRSAVTSLVTVCSPTGRIFFEVPDAKRYADFLHSPFQDFNTEHINHFSKDALRNLMKPFGFSLINEQRTTIQGPSGLELACLAVAFERTTRPAGDTAWHIDKSFRPSMQRYIAESRSMMTRLDQQLQAALASSSQAIVWGTGQLTMKLLSDTVLKDVNVIAFIDGNRIHAGKRLRGTPILGPSEVPDQHTPIVISSLLHADGILAKIHSLRLKNPVITLSGHSTDI